jgi:hypothetical protein
VNKERNIAIDIGQLESFDKHNETMRKLMIDLQIKQPTIIEFLLLEERNDLGPENCKAFYQEDVL